MKQTPLNDESRQKIDRSLSIDQLAARVISSGIIAATELADLRRTIGRSKPLASDLANLLLLNNKIRMTQLVLLVEGRAERLIIDNYEVIDELGHGGMGRVYRAVHRIMKRTEAVKVISPKLVKDKNALARFRREIEAAARLSHSNIVTAHHAGEFAGMHYLAMELVEGPDLSSLVENYGTLRPSKVVNYIRQIASALHYAHSRGIVHRDVKPSNLLVDASGTIKILDMGLAKIDEISSANKVSELTQTGVFMGTVDYMAPEQAMNAKGATSASDVYSLGCVMYFLCTGSPPYTGDTLVARIIAHKESPVPLLPWQEAHLLMDTHAGPKVKFDQAVLRSFEPELFQQATVTLERLQEIFQKMLAKPQTDRYSSMQDVADNLVEVANILADLSKGEASQTPSWVPDTANPPQKNMLVDDTASNAKQSAFTDTRPAPNQPSESTTPGQRSPLAKLRAIGRNLFGRSEPARANKRPRNTKAGASQGYPATNRDGATAVESIPGAFDFDPADSMGSFGDTVDYESSTERNLQTFINLEESGFDDSAVDMDSALIENPINPTLETPPDWTRPLSNPGSSVRKVKRSQEVDVPKRSKKWIIPAACLIILFVWFANDLLPGTKGGKGTSEKGPDNTENSAPAPLAPYAFTVDAALQFARPASLSENHFDSDLTIEFAVNPAPNWTPWRMELADRSLARYIAIEFESDGHLIARGDHFSLKSDDPLNSGDLQHIAYVQHREGPSHTMMHSIYVNGVRIASEPRGKNENKSASASGLAFYSKSLSSSPNIEFFPIEIDAVRISKSARYTGLKSTVAADFADDNQATLARYQRKEVEDDVLMEDLAGNFNHLRLRKTTPTN
jgi:serine/threonine protein kinase